jgi:hypothetical protein
MCTVVCVQALRKEFTSLVNDVEQLQTEQKKAMETIFQVPLFIPCVLHEVFGVFLLKLDGNRLI